MANNCFAGDLLSEQALASLLGNREIQIVRAGNPNLTYPALKEI